jgi:hypothetical protein
MFTEQELQQLTYFLNKATLVGGESLAHAQLVIKIQNLIQRETAEE